MDSEARICYGEAGPGEFSGMAVSLLTAILPSFVALRCWSLGTEGYFFGEEVDLVYTRVYTTIWWRWLGCSGNFTLFRRIVPRSAQTGDQRRLFDNELSRVGGCPSTKSKSATSGHRGELAATPAEQSTGATSGMPGLSPGAPRTTASGCDGAGRSCKNDLTGG